MVLSELTPAQRELVERMAALRFGAIEDLHVVGGEPSFRPPPRVIRELKFGDRGAQSTHKPDEPLLKRHVVQLLDALKAIGDGVITRLEVRHGLPHRAVIVESIQREEVPSCR